MRYRFGGELDLSAFVDASWAVHDDCHGRTGIVIMMAGCAVASWTFKQKIVTVSSTESELVALSDALKHIMWFRRFLTAQGFVLGPIPVYQDNKSVLELMKGGRKSHQRTKHLDVRLFYASDLDKAGDIALEWIPTTDMIADLMTKPLQGQTFKHLTAPARQPCRSWHH